MYGLNYVRQAESDRELLFRIFETLLYLTLYILFRVARTICRVCIDWNDERVIRSIERDVITSARRMNKVAAR